jgi:Ca2+-binding EF-hand superfamily protein
MTRHIVLAGALTAMGLALLPLHSQGQPAATRTAASSTLQRLDTDHDGTVDLAEANTAATETFDRLDRDHDSTLDRRELRGRLTARQFAAADPDHDGTISRDEYVALVEMRFNAADTDHDGTLDQKELNSSAGRALLQLIQ